MVVSLALGPHNNGKNNIHARQKLFKSLIDQGTTTLMFNEICCYHLTFYLRYVSCTTSTSVQVQ